MYLFGEDGRSVEISSLSSTMDSIEEGQIGLTFVRTPPTWVLCVDLHKLCTASCGMDACQKPCVGRVDVGLTRRRAINIAQLMERWCAVTGGADWLGQLLLTSANQRWAVRHV